MAKGPDDVPGSPGGRAPATKEDDKEECAWCKYMKAGGCRDPFEVRSVWGRLPPLETAQDRGSQLHLGMRAGWKETRAAGEGKWEAGGGMQETGGGRRGAT
jgi:hypothetical protein